MKVNGHKTICMARVNTSGQTAESTRGNLLTTTDMVRAFSIGLIKGGMRGCGKRVKCMAKAP
jgi:hypothetical protein